jgi:hypothetical protein
MSAMSYKRFDPRELASGGMASRNRRKLFLPCSQSLFSLLADEDEGFIREVLRVAAFESGACSGGVARNRGRDNR